MIYAVLVPAKILSLENKDLNGFIIMKKRLLTVQGPIQFIAAYIAMEWFSKIKHCSSCSETVLLMFDFLMPENLEQDLVQIITRLAALQKWTSIVFISSADMSALMKGKYSTRIEKLHQILGESAFDEIYLSRDFCSHGSPLILNAYPDATRITYGDSLGVVGNFPVRDKFNWSSPVRSLLSKCKASLLGLINGRPKKYLFDFAVLILPLDWSGSYLDEVPLLVPEKDFIISACEAISSNLDDLNAYCEFLLKDTKPENNYLVLLSNLSLSDLMSQRNEIALYLDIIRHVIKKDSTVFLKAHPRGSSEILNSIVECLKCEYKIKIIDDDNLSKLPIELWGKLIEKCTIVPIFSTSAINMKYISNKEVLLPLNDLLIKDFFYKDQIHRMIKSNESIQQSILALESWDGRSVLWKGVN